MHWILRFTRQLFAFGLDYLLEFLGVKAVFSTTALEARPDAESDENAGEYDGHDKHRRRALLTQAKLLEPGAKVGVVIGWIETATH